eukprot:3274133-Amphidinium_carterae.3
MPLVAGTESPPKLTMKGGEDAAIAGLSSSSSVDSSVAVAVPPQALADEQTGVAQPAQSDAATDGPVSSTRTSTHSAADVAARAAPVGVQQVDGTEASRGSASGAVYQPQYGQASSTTKVDRMQQLTSAVGRDMHAQHLCHFNRADKSRCATHSCVTRARAVAQQQQQEVDVLSRQLVQIKARKEALEDLRTAA